MTTYRTTFGSTTHVFDDLKTLLAKASPHRSGDELAVLAAVSDEERMAARFALADVRLSDFLAEPIIPYETDEVTRLICDTHDAAAFAPLSSLTVGQFREWLLAYETGARHIAAASPGLTPEMVAAVSKLMRNQDLILVAKKCSVVSKFRNTLGLPGRMAVRLQPNHPTDDPAGIAASILDGLCYGCGDAVIGINPATDNVANTVRLVNLVAELIERFEIPTQSCVLAHVTTSLRAISEGAPVDLVFQSIAGTEAANKSFGVDLAVLKEGREAALGLGRGTVGDNCMYF
ncbi:MAG: ethanolamine ammonia-lyase subunit EutB, partial [Candidatus Saccharimonas sp.]|nr:ethanolamine ammonia-lyase subunit EutB [Planctomycetaceae bacterium]